MGRIRKVCAFCGSSPGARPDYSLAAKKLGRRLADRGTGLVYGGARVGTMGDIADAVLKEGGEVIGVMPRLLVEKEVAHEHLTELHVIDTMHERKSLMADLSDGFIALSGGLGTLDELFEVVTWAQLGMHAKPCGLLNVCGYFDLLKAYLDHAVSERFIEPRHREMILMDESADALLDQFESYQPPVVEKWLDRRN